jgi:hypothetical protein
LLAETERRRLLQAAAKDQLIAALSAALKLWLRYAAQQHQGKHPEKAKKMRLAARKATKKVLA